MDAVKLIDECKRICKFYDDTEGGCGNCPLNHLAGCGIFDCVKDVEGFVGIVERWSKDHPIKTNLQKFTEVFGVSFTRLWCGLPPDEWAKWLNAEYKTPKKPGENNDGTKRSD